MIVQTLSAPECTTLLAKNRLAPFPCARDGQPYLVPIYNANARQEDRLDAGEPIGVGPGRRTSHGPLMEKRRRRRPLPGATGSHRQQG
jgi:hypothetical protein